MDKELIYATFIRHTHAHVYQDSFEYEVERGNPVHNQAAAVRTKQMVPPVRCHVDVDEAHRIVDAILQKYGNDDTRVAVNFAHKIGPHADRLDGAMTALEKERDKDRLLSNARRPRIENTWQTKP